MESESEWAVTGGHGSAFNGNEGNSLLVKKLQKALKIMQRDINSEDDTAMRRVASS